MRLVLRAVTWRFLPNDRRIRPLSETFNLLPRMGWGLPNSAGHYVDLVSAIAGLILLPTGFVARWLARRRRVA
jgi:hypothetical protein